MANTLGEKELKTKWPVILGLTADSKHEGRIINLTAQGHLGVKTIVKETKKVGL